MKTKRKIFGAVCAAALAFTLAAAVCAMTACGGATGVFAEPAYEYYVNAKQSSVLAGSELETGVPDAVPQEDDTPWWVIALIVGGCVAVPLVAVVRMLRCPRCKRWFALRSQGERIVLRAEGWRMVEQTLVCRRCGETIRRRRREADGSDIGGRGGGMWIGGRGLFGGGFGGGHAGGGFGGGSFGGGGAGSKW